MHIIFMLPKAKELDIIHILYCCEMYPTCVSSKLCVFIALAFGSLCLFKLPLKNICCIVRASLHCVSPVDPQIFFLTRDQVTMNAFFWCPCPSNGIGCFSPLCFSICQLKLPFFGNIKSPKMHL